MAPALRCFGGAESPRGRGKITTPSSKPPPHRHHPTHPSIASDHVTSITPNHALNHALLIIAPSNHLEGVEHLEQPRLAEALRRADLVVIVVLVPREAREGVAALDDAAEALGDKGADRAQRLVGGAARRLGVVGAQRVAQLLLGAALAARR